MAVLDVQITTTGLVPNTSGLGIGMTQQLPVQIYITTNDTLATVTTAGYLNQSVTRFQYAYNNYQMALVYTTDAGCTWLRVSVSYSGATATYSLVTPTEGSGSFSTILLGNGTAAAPSLSFTSDPDTGIYRSAANTVAVSANGALVAAFATTGLSVTGLISASTTLAAGTTITAGTGITATTGNITASTGNLVSTLGSVSAATTVTAGTGVTATTGNITASAGNLVAGATGAAGTVTSFSGTGTAEFLRLAAIDNAGGNFSTTISNASSVGQSQTISIPDAGAATANFLLDTGTANIIAQQQFVGLNSILLTSAGTWTTTRVAQGNYALVHTPADDTAIIGIDITPIIRATAAKGFRLDSFDVIYSIGTLAMDAHTLTLDRIAYANNVAVSITSIALTGSLSTATQAQPYVTNIAVTTPAFDITADSKYVVEVTANNAATTDYSFYGLMLHFSQTIG